MPGIIPNNESWGAYPHTSEAMGGSVQESYFTKNLENLPKLHFPSFDGENPKLWQSRCEDYFLIYSGLVRFVRNGPSGIVPPGILVLFILKLITWNSSRS